MTFTTFVGIGSSCMPCYSRNLCPKGFVVINNNRRRLILVAVAFCRNMLEYEDDYFFEEDKM